MGLGESEAREGRTRCSAARALGSPGPPESAPARPRCPARQASPARLLLLLRQGCCPPYLPPGEVQALSQLRHGEGRGLEAVGGGEGVQGRGQDGAAVVVQGGLRRRREELLFRGLQKPSRGGPSLPSPPSPPGRGQGLEPQHLDRSLPPPGLAAPRPGPAHLVLQVGEGHGGLQPQPQAPAQRQGAGERTVAGELRQAQDGVRQPVEVLLGTLGAAAEGEEPSGRSLRSPQDSPGPPTSLGATQALGGTPARPGATHGRAERRHQPPRQDRLPRVLVPEQLRHLGPDPRKAVVQVAEHLEALRKGQRTAAGEPRGPALPPPGSTRGPGSPAGSRTPPRRSAAGPPAPPGTRPLPAASPPARRPPAGWIP